MPPQYPDPYFSSSQHPAAPPLGPVHGPRRHSVLDITITAIISAFAALAALGSLWFSMFFAMATDSCGEQCDDAALSAAYLVTWGGITLAVLVAASGIVIAAVRGWVMWIWPTLALGLIVGALGIGILLANSVMHHN
jgi:hypothetical protein